MSEEKMQLEITSDPGSARFIIQELVKELRGPNGRGASREVSLAITKLQEAGYWLGEAMFGSGSQLTQRAADLAVCTCEFPKSNLTNICSACGKPISPNR